MHTKERVFTREETRIAICALLLAGVLALFGFVIQDMVGPATPWGADQSDAAMPGVMDAQPVG